MLEPLDFLLVLFQHNDLGLIVFCDGCAQAPVAEKFRCGVHTEAGLRR